jgi:hypothetical protein
MYYPRIFLKELRKTTKDVCVFVCVLLPCGSRIEPAISRIRSRIVNTSTVASDSVHGAFGAEVWIL